ATKRSLQLDHRIAALAGQAPGHRLQQQAHALGNEGAAEEQYRILVLGGRTAFVHLGDVGGELGLLESAAMHVFVRYCELAPGFERHVTTPRSNFSWEFRPAGATIHPGPTVLQKP